MSRDPIIYLEDIQASCKKILTYIDGMNFDEFTASSMTYDAVMRNLEIIGEATKNVPEDFKNQYQQWNGGQPQL